MLSISRRAGLIMLIGLPLAIGAPEARADTSSEASDFVQALIGKALAILKQSNLSASDRDRAFGELLSQNFDIPRIARFVVGRYWSSASEEERNRFIDTYRNFVISSYASRFAEYTGETVRVTRARPESENVTIVNSELIHPNGDPPVKIAWRVYKQTDGYRIVDVDVEGVSMMVTQREEFASVIQRSGGSVAGLTQAIQQKMQGGGTQSGG